MAVRALMSSIGTRRATRRPTECGDAGAARNHQHGRRQHRRRDGRSVHNSCQPLGAGELVSDLPAFTRPPR